MPAAGHMRANPVLQPRDPDSKGEGVLSSLREGAVSKTSLQAA